MRINISSKRGAKIPEGMMGLFIEDINYTIDGGLYAEMIENRTFEFLDAFGGTNEDYFAELDGLYGWKAYPSDENITLRNVIGSPVHENNPHYLRVTSNAEMLGFTNKAYDGIYMKPGVNYIVSFYARLVNYSGDLRIAIMKEGLECVSKEIDTLPIDVEKGRRWEKHQVVLQSNVEIEKAEFLIQLTNAGVVEFDFISMIPEDAVNGIFRKDLVDVLKNLNPSFLRFPGGCVVEGMTLANRYKFKDSIGALEGRKLNWNRWAVHGNNESNNYHGMYSHYNQTLGIGYYEYFLLCETIGAKPLPVVNVGMACQYQSHEQIDVTDCVFREYIQEALDIIEFANGSKESQWGQLRCMMGHPEPFNLEMLGVGNEQWETEYADYFKRYKMFEEAIHSEYPEIKLIGSAGPELDSERFNKAWKFYRGATKENPSFVYAVDEHFYTKPKWFLEHANFYDTYPREVKSFFGEYAAHPEGLAGMNRMDANTLEGALSEAAFLTGIERNSDVVVMASYAPLLARAGYAQWSPNLIWFNGNKICTTPSYYVQQMYGTNMGTVNLESDMSEEDLFFNVTYDESSSEIIIKVVNVQSQCMDLEIDTNGFNTDGEDVIFINTTVLSGNALSDSNSFDDEKVTVTRERFEIKKIYQVPQYSFVILRFSARRKEQV